MAACDVTQAAVAPDRATGVVGAGKHFEHLASNTSRANELGTTATGEQTA